MFLDKENSIFILNNRTVFNRTYRIKYRFGFVDRTSSFVCTVIVFFCPRRPGRGWLVSGPGSASRGRNFSSCTGSILLSSYVWRNPTEMTHTNKPFIEQSEIIRFREFFLWFCVPSATLFQKNNKSEFDKIWWSVF